MTPIVQHLKLQIRFNPNSWSVELKTAPDTEDSGVDQKAQDFLEAYMMGFEILKFRTQWHSCAWRIYMLSCF
jgi:RNA-binding protein PNO1